MKLTSKMLRRIIEEEVAKFGAMKDVEDVEAVEVDADEHGTDKTAEKHIDFMKALKVEEMRLRRRLAKITETRSRIAKKRA